MDWANKGCVEFAGLLLDLEGHRCTFRQVVEPDVAYIAASKRVGLPVFSKERSGASVAPELRNGARHTLMADLFQEMPKVCTLAAMAPAATSSPLIALALVNKLSSPRVIRKSFAVKF
jgi:hypothetical protein